MSHNWLHTPDCSGGGRGRGEEGKKQDVESQGTYQKDEVLSLHNLQQLDDAAMSQPPQDADLSLNAPLIHRLLHKHQVTWLSCCHEMSSHMSQLLSRNLKSHGSAAFLKQQVVIASSPICLGNN